MIFWGPVTTMVQYSNNLSLWGMHTEVLNNMSRWWRCPCIVSASWLIDARGGTDRVERGLTGVSGEIDTLTLPHPHGYAPLRFLLHVTFWGVFEYWMCLVDMICWLTINYSNTSLCRAKDVVCCILVVWSNLVCKHCKLVGCARIKDSESLACKLMRRLHLYTRHHSIQIFVDAKQMQCNM